MLYYTGEIIGRNGLTFERVLQEMHLRFYVADGVRYLFAANAKNVTATQKKLNYRQAERFFEEALKNPIFERTTLDGVTPDRWSSFRELLNDIIENFDFGEKIAVGLNELFGDLHRGDITDASLQKLKTAVQFTRECRELKDFYLAIYKISYDHGQYDKATYEMMCRQVTEKGVW